MALKKSDIANLPARITQPRKLFDGGGLYLRVTETGMHWKYKYRLNRPGQPDHHREKTASFGEYSATPVAADDLKRADFDMARKRHAEARQVVKAGGDPAAEAKDAKLSGRATVHAKRQATRKLTAKLVYAKAVDNDETSAAIFAPDTVGFTAEAYDATLAKRKRAPKTRARDERMKRYVQNSFGSVGITDADAPHLVNLLDLFEGKNNYATRQRVQRFAFNTMEFARGKGWLNGKSNPFHGVGSGNAYTPPANTPRPAIIEPVPFGKLLRDVATYRGRQGNLVGMALELTNLTFVRPGNIATAEWKEFDLDEALWTMPFGKLKQRAWREKNRELGLSGKPHYVPLSRQAVTLLRKLETLTGSNQWLFPAAENESGHITVEGIESGINLLNYQGVHCPHGFRSSASTMLNVERVTVEGVKIPRFAEQAIEFQLEHVDKTTAAIYNRNQLLEEREVLMQFWADKCDAMRDGKIAKVAKFKAVA